MKICRLLGATCALAALMTLVSCASRSSLSSWYDQNYTSAGFRNVCVLVRNDDLSIRRDVEEGVVEKLSQQGIRAISSLDVISPSDNHDYPVDWSGRPRRVRSGNNLLQSIR